MSDTLFHKIIRREIPATLVYEDEDVLGFRDIAPQAPVHILVIPKAHVLSSAREIGAEHGALIAHIYEVMARLARELGLEGGYRVVTNAGEDAGQTVLHLHFHMLAGGQLGAMA